MKKSVRVKGYDAGGAVRDAMNGVVGMYNAYERGRAYKATADAKEPVVDNGNFDTGAARGGKIRRTSGPRIGKDDGLIPAQKGEYVVRKSAVNKLGTKALNTINKGKLPARKGR